MIRELKVFLRSGVYPLTSTLNFDGGDSGFQRAQDRFINLFQARRRFCPVAVS